MKQRRIALGIALLSILLLAASLSNLELLPGRPFPGASQAEGARFSLQPAPPLQAYLVPVLQGTLALVFTTLLVYVSARILRYVDFKEIARWGLVLALLVGAMLALPHTPIHQALPQPGGFRPGEETQAATYDVTPLGNPPPVMVWLACATLLGSLGLVVARALKRHGETSENGDPLLAGAETAVDGLQSGLDLRNVILRCYTHMSHAIQEERGMARERTLTAREFEQALADQGFPARPVHQLTALFERVRYSTHASDSWDEALALDSLDEIVRYCRQGRQPTYGPD